MEQSGKGKSLLDLPESIWEYHIYPQVDVITSFRLLHTLKHIFPERHQEMIMRSVNEKLTTFSSERFYNLTWSLVFGTPEDVILFKHILNEFPKVLQKKRVRFPDWTLGWAAYGGKLDLVELMLNSDVDFPQDELRGTHDILESLKRGAVMCSATCRCDPVELTHVSNLIKARLHDPPRPSGRRMAIDMDDSSMYK